MSLNKERRPLYIFLFSSFGSVIMGLFAARKFMQSSDFIIGFSLAACSFLLLVASYLLAVKNDRRSGTWLILAMLYGLSIVILLVEKSESSALFWIVLFPLVAFYTKGVVKGSLLCALQGGTVLFLVSLSAIDIISLPYMLSFYLRILLVYTMVCLMTFVYKMTIQKREEKIYQQIYYNPLTRLPSRRMLIDDLATPRNLTLMLVNLDDFKVINDLFGAKIGDSTLKETGKRLSSFKSDPSVLNVYKLHADEYAVLLKEQCQRTAEDFAERVIALLTEDFCFDDICFSLSVSIGISNCFTEILADADIALRQAKENKRSYVFYDGSAQVSQEYKTNIETINILRIGMKNNDLIPYFQPISRNSDGTISKYECLVRLKHNNNIYPPQSFLDLSKRVKLYPEITRIMIDKCLKHFEDIPCDFSLNLCKEDILEEKTVTLILERLRHRPLAERVIFELLETEEIENIPEVSDFIEKIHDLGAKIAIDDFGSGYSNFEYMLRLNVDYIKIDSSLIKNIVDDRNSRILTENIVDFCHKMNIQTVAEFVHNDQVYRMVKELGIDFSQGYFIGKPEEETLHEKESYSLDNLVS